jgi:7-cyano-7-deazaguanine synthase in queuosine biosynthesis
MPNSVGCLPLRGVRRLVVVTLWNTLVAGTAAAQAPWRLVEELRFGTGESDSQTFTDCNRRRTE